MQKTRLLYFDLLKFLAIFLVIWGHCIQFFLSSYECMDSVYLAIYSFHMPLFMMISGYFSLNSYSLMPNAFLKKKTQELILPVFTWGVIFEGIHIIINLCNWIPLYTYYDLKAFYIHNLWFLKSLFVCYIFAYCCFKQGRTNYFMLLATFIVSQFITYSNICTMYPAFLCGIILKRRQGIIRSYYILGGTFTLFTILLQFWDASFWPIPDMLYGICNKNLDTFQDYVYKGGYRIVIGIIGSTFFISLFMLLFSKHKSNMIKLLSCYGKYTLGVYILQSFILEYALGRYVNFDNTNYWLFHFVYAPIISLTLVLCFTYIVRFTYNYKKISLLLWGKKTKSTIHESRTIYPFSFKCIISLL